MSKLIKPGQFVNLAYCNPPHDFTRQHLLVLPHRHVLSLRNLGGTVVGEAYEMACWAEEHFKMRGGGFTLRFGEREFNAGSIYHYHWNLQEPDGKGRVQATFYKDLKEIAEDEQRAARFAAVYEQADREGYLSELVAGVRVPVQGFDWKGKADWPTA